jgi:BlaI family penicillinase repressor
MKLTEAEWLIMNALWEGHPARAREVSERLPGDVNWAYTTIKTMLSRLVEKKAVRERKRGNASVYEPIVSRQNARRSALRALVNQEEERLTAKQRRELIKILENRKKAKGERK